MFYSLKIKDSVNSSYYTMVYYIVWYGDAHLRFCKLHNIVTDIIQQSKMICTQARLLISPHLILKNKHKVR